jgi:virginiamycin B lyase
MLKSINLLGASNVLASLIIATALIGCNRSEEENPGVAEDQSPETTITGMETILTGVINNASGQPVSGAIVKVTGVNTGLSYMVVSQALGQYRTPELLPGMYTIQSFGGRYQSELSEPLPVGSDQQGVADQILNIDRVIPPPAKKLTNLDYVQLMPEGEAKKLIASRCTMCHGLDRVVPARKSPQAWQITIDRMTYFLAARMDLGGPVSAGDKESILEYVSMHFTRDTPRIFEPKPSDPNQNLPANLLQGVQARFIAMTFTPQIENGIPDTEFGLDSRGNIWISEVGSPYFGRFDPATLSYTRLQIPAGNFERSYGQIAPDPQDKVWILDNGSSPSSELIQYDPLTAAFKSYLITAPLRYRAPLNTLRFLDGNVWGTGNASSRIVKLDPRTGEVTEYPTPRGSHPFGIAIGADRAVWYITNYNNQIVRLDPASGEQTPYRPPTLRSGLRRMGADAVGNLWAGAQDTNKLVKLDSRTGEVTEYIIPTEGGEPYSVDVDTTRNLVWLSERGADKLARFDPRTETFIEFPLPAVGIEATRILVDPVNANRVWWSCSEGCSFGFIETLE